MAGVAILWVLNALDLLLTQQAASQGMLTEANPLAAPWISHPGLLLGYKLALVSIGTGILLRFRRHPWSEPACVLSVAIYGGVLYSWTLYHHYLETCLNDPATVRPPLMF